MRFLSVCLAGLSLAPLFAQVQNFKPVTQQQLENPSPDDWLMYSRTYDAQRFSPLKQITRDNVGQLKMAWSRGLPSGQTETIPLVHDGVMYLVAPGALVQAEGAGGRRRSGAHQESGDLSGRHTVHCAG